jgi:tetratricopeptide (TPR) repeat protein
MLEHDKTFKAKELALEAIKSTKKMTGNNAVNTARAYQVLGICYLHDGDFFNAEIQFRNAYNINISLYGEINANTAECNQWLAICFIKQNKLVEAYKEYSKALEIFRNTLGSEHPTCIYAEEQVSELRRYL